MKKLNLLICLLFLCPVIIVFRNWFINPEIIGGDWFFYYKEYLSQTSLYPYIWTPWHGNGMGGINSFLGLHGFSSLVQLFYRLTGLSWSVVYKIGWFGFYILLSILSISALQRAVFGTKLRIEVQLIGILIYLTNTYALMLVGGGQMGVALSYAIAPLVLARFIKLISAHAYLGVNSKFQIPNFKQIQNFKSKIRSILICGLVLAAQVMLDPRIAYITMLGVVLYTVVCSWNLVVRKIEKEKIFLSLSRLFFSLAIILIIAVLLNAYWLMPLIMLRSNPLQQMGTVYTSIEALKFFSFADFSHALSLVHPNWPENIFGKTYFLQSEFLVLPILAFTSLFIVSRKKNNNIIILFFSLLAFLGVFLAKGVNPPFGDIFIWMFSNIPGFVMFRDPTKFYTLIVLSYAILIPYALRMMAKWLETKRVKKGSLLPIVFILFWFFTTRQAVLGKLSGTFTNKIMPEEYILLKDFVYFQPEYFRTLWVPRLHRLLSFSVNIHPASEAETLFETTSSAQLSTVLSKPGIESLLSRLSIKYFILPTDPFGDIFLSDRKYDNALREQYEKVLDKVDWLKKQKIGNITVYKTFEHRDHFWIDSKGDMSYKVLNQSSYMVNIKASEPMILYFSESYHPGWVARVGDNKIYSNKTQDNLNSFLINTNGNIDIHIYFEPQKYVDIGVVVSSITFTLLIAILLIYRVPSHPEKRRRVKFFGSLNEI